MSRPHYSFTHTRTAAGHRGGVGRVHTTRGSMPVRLALLLVGFKACCKHTTQLAHHNAHPWHAAARKQNKHTRNDEHSRKAEHVLRKGTCVTS